MMHDKTIRTFRTLTLGASRAVILSMLSGLVSVACAGGDTPVRDRELEASIREAYVGGGPVAAAGGAGGVAPSGAGGAAPAPPPSGAGGSEPAPPPAGMGGSEPVAAGGSGGEDPPPGGCDGFAILQASCSGGSCHSGEGGLTPFAQDLETAESLVGEESAICGGDGDVFDSGAPAASLVVEKMKGTSPCGGQMPLGAAPLSDADITCVEEWIGTL
jgi:hypothetical protein